MPNKICYKNVSMLLFLRLLLKSMQETQFEFDVEKNENDMKCYQYQNDESNQIEAVKQKRRDNER